MPLQSAAHSSRSQTIRASSTTPSPVKEGLDQKTSGQLVGAPLFVNRTRGWTFVNWVVDNGGYLLVENGRVKFRQAPRGPAPATVPHELAYSTR